MSFKLENQDREWEEPRREPATTPLDGGRLWWETAHLWAVTWVRVLGIVDMVNMTDPLTSIGLTYRGRTHWVALKPDYSVRPSGPDDSDWVTPVRIQLEAEARRWRNLVDGVTSGESPR